MSLRPSLVLAALAFGGLAKAHANVQLSTQQFQSNTIALQSMDWSGELALPQFDAALGTLRAVSVELSSTLGGSAKVESLNTSAATVALRVDAALSLGMPNGRQLVLVAPLAALSFDASAYDGVRDYAGSSGISYTDLSRSSSQSISFSDAADLAQFTGTGSIRAPLSASATTQVDGPGSFASSFRTRAGAQATVSYSYQPTSAVPEPESWALMVAGLGLGGLAARRRRA